MGIRSAMRMKRKYPRHGQGDIRGAALKKADAMMAMMMMVVPHLISSSITCRNLWTLIQHDIQDRPTLLVILMTVPSHRYSS